MEVDARRLDGAMISCGAGLLYENVASSNPMLLRIPFRIKQPDTDVERRWTVHVPPIRRSKKTKCKSVVNAERALVAAVRALRAGCCVLTHRSTAVSLRETAFFAKPFRLICRK